MGTLFHDTVQFLGLTKLPMENPPTYEDDRTSGVQSIERAIAILKALSLDKQELGVTELSRQLSLHKSTTSRLLASLQREGLVEENPVTRKYRLGMGLATLGGLVLQRLDVTQVARPLMEALADTTRETVTLVVKDRDEAVNIAQVPSPQTVKHIEWVGRRSPLHCTAAGKVLLAHACPSEQQSIVSRGLRPYTPNTTTDPSALSQELVQAKEQGYAIGREDFEIGLNEIAAPICDHTGEVMAAISISGPAFRVSPERFVSLIQHVQQAASTLSERLGCCL
jgi:DNA-binding IclR family transcriptional regulator